MDFDIVIATRNRQAALKLSLPLMLGQNRLPARLIIVDSSDDHEKTRAVVEAALTSAARRADVRIYASPPGTSLQRNKGLEHVASPVAFFPDDDALWFPGVTEAIMRIYERDGRGLIGGVRAEESFTSPVALSGRNNGGPYKMALRDKLQLRIGRIQYRLEKRYFPDPLFVEAENRHEKLDKPDWLEEENAFLCGPMFGFSMTFRTDVIKEADFDESLGRYALFEDLDASLAVLDRRAALVCARNARVFHFRAPESRVNGKEWGVMHVLNRTYVLCKHSPPGSNARRLHSRFNYYKLARYALQAHGSYGRERLRGAWRAMLLAPRLLDSSKEELAPRYVQLRRQCLER